MGEENNPNKVSDKNVNKKFIRGDHGLPATFWGGGVGATFVLLFFIGSLMDAIGSDTAAYWGMVFFFFYSIFISIAIWRASDQYPGPVHWGVLSKIAVILTLGLVLLVYMYLGAMLSARPIH